MIILNQNENKAWLFHPVKDHKKSVYTYTGIAERDTEKY